MNLEIGAGVGSLDRKDDDHFLRFEDSKEVRGEPQVAEEQPVVTRRALRNDRCFVITNCFTTAVLFITNTVINITQMLANQSSYFDFTQRRNNITQEINATCPCYFLSESKLEAISSTYNAATFNNIAIPFVSFVFTTSSCIFVTLANCTIQRRIHKICTAFFGILIIANGILIAKGTQFDMTGGAVAAFGCYVILNAIPKSIILNGCNKLNGGLKFLCGKISTCTCNILRRRH